jgi:hypothetical protein
MKKTVLIIFGCLLAFSFHVQAQEEASEYFVGSWKVFVEGTPAGDINMVFNLTKNDDEWSGTISGDNRPDTQFTKVEVEQNSFTVYWTSEVGYDVFVTLEKAGENKLEGSLMNMFDATGERSQ